MPKKYGFILVFFGLFIFIFPSLLGLFHKGFFVSDDGNWMVIRFSGFYQALRFGQFPVRFIPRLNNGYGYPVADFLYPLFMYLAVPIKVFGFSFVNSVKIVFGLSLLLSGYFCFFWLKRIFNIFAAFSGAVAYVLFPYHLFDIYKRGSVGEVLSLAIVPFILWQIESKNYLLISIGIGLLILAHNTLALLFLPIILAYFFIYHKNNYSMHIMSVILGVLMSAFFWLPALWDKQFTVFDTTAVANFSTYFLSSKSLDLIGEVGFLGVIISSILYLKNRNNKLLFFLVINLVSIFLCFTFSNTLWNLIPGKNLIQFPFRLLSVVCIANAFILASFINIFQGRLKYFTIFFIILIIYLSSWGFLYPKNFQYYPDGYYSTNTDTTTVKNEYMPVWVKIRDLSFKQHDLEFINGKGTIVSITSNGTNISSFVKVFKESVLQLNYIYYPGWDIWIDGKKATINYANSYGLMRFNLPLGSHIIIAKFTETNLRLVADFISCLSIVIAFIIKKKYA